MDISIDLAATLLVLAFVLTAFVALAEVSLATISRAHVRKLGEEGVSSALLVESTLQNIERFLSGMLVLKTLAIGLAVAAATWLAVQLDLGSAVIWVLLGVGLILLLLQVSGRVVAIQHPTGVALNVVRPIRSLILLAAPVTWLLIRIAQSAGAQNETTTRNIFLTEDGLRLLINFSEEERFIEAEERQMIDSIFRFSETTVEEVMVPRVDVVALDQEVRLLEALDTIVGAGHSRIPVYAENIDRIVGVLFAKDLLTCYRDGRTDISIKEVMREPYFVPESAMVDDLLEDLQHKQTHMAIVVDEYGGTAGIVTIEDLLEEIVGEIQDEYDSEMPLLEMLGEGVYVANGRIDIDDLNRDLGIQLPDEEESYTLAGVIYSQLQRVPDVGDTLVLGNVRLEVLEVTDNRIEQVQLEVLPALDGDEAVGITEEAG